MCGVTTFQLAKVVGVGELADEVRRAHEAGEVVGSHERFGGHAIIDAANIATNIELTRFPVPRTPTTRGN
jgi:hypothetical protein